MELLTPRNIKEFFDALTPAKARTKAVREALAAAGRAHQLFRKKFTGGTGREPTKEHDPKAKICWCVECRRKFPSYRNRPKAQSVRVRTVRPLPNGLPLTPSNIARFFDSLMEKDIHNTEVHDALTAAARVFPKLRSRSGPLPKITPDIQQRIKRMYAEGQSQLSIANALGLAQTSVSNVVRAGDRDTKPIRSGRPSVTSVILSCAEKERPRDKLIEMVLKKLEDAKPNTVDVIISQMLKDGRLVHSEKGLVRGETHGDS
jgi:predicted transcriptional regulator